MAADTQGTQTLAERFANMLVLTNDMPDLRKLGIEEFYPLANKSISMRDSLFALFKDNSFFLNVKGKITVINDATDPDSKNFFLQFFAKLRVEDPDFLNALLAHVVKSMSKKEIEAVEVAYKELGDYAQNMHA